MVRKYQGPLQPGKRSAKVTKGKKTKSVIKQTKTNTTAIKQIRSNQNQSIYYKAQTSHSLKGTPWTVIPLTGGPASAGAGSDASCIWQGNFGAPGGTKLGNFEWKPIFGDQLTAMTYDVDQTLRVNSCTLDIQIIPKAENELTNISIFLVSVKKESAAQLDRPIVPGISLVGTVSNNTTANGGAILTSLTGNTHYANDDTMGASNVSVGAFTHLNPKHFKIHKQWMLNTQGSQGAAGAPATEEQNQLLTNGSMGYWRRRHFFRMGTVIKNTGGSILDMPPEGIPIPSRRYLLVFHDGYNIDLEYPEISILAKYNCTTQR